MLSAPWVPASSTHHVCQDTTPEQTGWVCVMCDNPCLSIFMPVLQVITPIAAQLAQQKHSQLAKLGCTVEEAPPGTVPADGKGISVAVGSHGRGGNNTGTNSSNSSGSGNGSSNGPALGQHDSTCGTSSSIAGTEALTAGAANGTGVASSLRQRKGCGSKGSSTAGSISSKAGGKANGMVMADPTGSKGWTTVAAGGAGQGMSHHRFESGKHWNCSTAFVLQFLSKGMLCR